MQSQYVNADGEVVKTSEPMSYYVTQELLNFSSGTEVVAYGSDARLANVKGLFIKAKMDSVVKASQAPAPAPAPAPVATTQTAPVATPAVEQTAPVQTATAPVTPVTPVAESVQTPVTNQATPVAPVAPQVTI